MISWESLSDEKILSKSLMLSYCAVDTADDVH